MSFARPKSTAFGAGLSCLGLRLLRVMRAAQALKIARRVVVAADDVVDLGRAVRTAPAFSHPLAAVAAACKDPRPYLLPGGG